MADLTYTLKADVRRASPATYGKGDAANLKVVTATKSVTARSQNDTLKMLTLPSNARISGLSHFAIDDIDTSGVTVDIGVGSVDSNVTSDADALNDGIDPTSAVTGKVVKDHANYGKMLWEFVNGQTSDPGGELDIYVSFVDASSDATGDVTLEIAYTLD